MALVASVLVDNLKQLGVTHVFGVPGKPIVPLILEMEDQGIEFVLSRHECGAGYAASGYALKKDTLGVAIGTSGPGGTNLLTAAAQAKAYHLPVLFITGQPPLQLAGRALGQDSSFFGTDLVEMFKHVTLFSARVDRGDSLQAYLKHSLENALTGIKGPVHLSIPLDVMLEEIDPFHITPHQESLHMISDSLHSILPLLNEAQKPIMMIGKGVHASKAYKEVQQFAEKWNIPVISTPGGKGAFPSNHPLSLGSFGLGGREEAANYLKSGIDLMIVIGSKLSDMSLAGFTKEMHPKKLIHFDYDLTFVGKSLPVPTIPVLGDAKKNLQQLIARPSPAIVNDFNITEYKSKTEEKGQEEVAAGLQETGESKQISSVVTMKILRECLPDNTTIFGDDGSHTFYAIQNFDIIQPGTFYFDDVFGAMGHAIGFSVGAKLASPDEPIVCLTGDGCLFMHGTEISTAVNHHANLILVVLNNGMLDMVDKGMMHNLGRSAGTRYETEINAKLFAESLGAKGYRCFTEDEIRKAIEGALAYQGPTVIEIMVDPTEIPPTLKRG